MHTPNGRKGAYLQSFDTGIESLRTALLGLVHRSFPGLRRSVRKNLAAVTLALLLLQRGGRSGNGRLSLSAIARALPTWGAPQARYRRLHRFLDCAMFSASGVATGLTRLIFGRRGRQPQLVPIIGDQVTVAGTEAFVMAAGFEGRALPVGIMCWSYPLVNGVWSQNQLERMLIASVADALPPGLRPIWILDRGYSRGRLLKEFNAEGELYVMRAKRNVKVKLGTGWVAIGKIVLPPRTVVRHSGVICGLDRKVPVDLIGYHDPEYKEPWYLLAPPRSEGLLPAAEVVALYRTRMRIEHTFRDWKTHLGARGLKLKVRKADRMARLLQALTIAYALSVALGADRVGRKLREQIEIERHLPRHGTRRTLSVLTVGTAAMARPQLAPAAYARLEKLIDMAADGRPLLPAPKKAG